MSLVEKNSSISSSDKATSHTLTIALDAMGGDHAPASVIKGAEIALAELSNLRFKIYGNKDKIAPLLNSCKKVAANCDFIHTDDIINNEEKPSNALRRGRNSSMTLSIMAVKNGEATAAISAGNTGALMAISKFSLRTLPGIDRPAIGGIMPTDRGFCVMLDLGANVHCEAENLFEFAVMGNAFYSAVFAKDNPTIGLLNVGAEKNKGSEAVKSALNLLQESGIDLNLYGYIEGDDIAKGTTDVVVTDGFSGNISLKSSEGYAKFYINSLKSELKSNIFGWLAAIFLMPALNKLKKKLDPRHYNGAMLLGLNGIVVKSHGSTDEVGFANAIKVAYKLAKNNINEHITREMISSGHVPIVDEVDMENDLDA